MTKCTVNNMRLASMAGLLPLLLATALGCSAGDGGANGAPGMDAAEGQDPALVDETAPESEEDEIATTEEALYQDGCSGIWARMIGGAIIDPYFFGSGGIFKDACITHDYCYQGGLATYGIGKSGCDGNFHTAMLNKCKSLWYLSFVDPTFVPRCNRMADLMFSAVSAAGGPYYKSSLCQHGEVYTSANHDSLTCSAWEPYAGTPTRAPVSCDGTDGQWNGCRGSGCYACTDLLAAYPKYFKNNPYCTPNNTCAGLHFRCNTACPAPTSRDR
jgi:hypothetical protein